MAAATATGVPIDTEVVFTFDELVSESLVLLRYLAKPFLSPGVGIYERSLFRDHGDHPGCLGL